MMKPKPVKLELEDWINIIQIERDRLQQIIHNVDNRLFALYIFAIGTAGITMSVNFSLLIPHFIIIILLTLIVLILHRYWRRGQRIGLSLYVASYLISLGLTIIVLDNIQLAIPQDNKELASLIMSTMAFALCLYAIINAVSYRLFCFPMMFYLNDILYSSLSGARESLSELQNRFLGFMKKIWLIERSQSINCAIFLGFRDRKKIKHIENDKYEQIFYDWIISGEFPRTSLGEFFKKHEKLYKESNED